MNISENTKRTIYKILENPYTSDLKEISPEELHQVQDVFSFGRCECFLKTSSLLQKYSKKDQKKLESLLIKLKSIRKAVI